MKKTSLIVIITLSLMSCAPKLIPNDKNENSLLGKINNQIENKIISKDALIYLNGRIISYPTLIELNIFDTKDFPEISYLNKKEGKKEYGKIGKNGVIILRLFLDPLLDSEYYKDINNTELLEFIEKSSAQGPIGKNPLLVVSGKPLRGKDIVNTVNHFKVKRMKVLPQVAGYRIYGIRAINGVIIID